MFPIENKLQSYFQGKRREYEKETGISESDCWMINTPPELS